MTITEPGIYDMPAEVYHADPCATPSLSAGMINDLLIAPAKCFNASSRLNPDYEASYTADKFTIGTVSHLMFLEPHLFESQVVVVEADDWRKKEVRAARADAKAANKTAILAKHLADVRAARASFQANSFTRAAFTDGVFEQCLFWRHPDHGFWCRARPDFLANSRRHVNDYKATANANPEQFGRHAGNMGYHRRAAWYLEGIEAVFGRRPDHYWFCNQETKAPWLTSVVELDEASLEAGQAENDHAADIFYRCLRSGEWPGYRHRNAPDRDLAFKVGLPPYALMQIDERTA